MTKEKKFDVKRMTSTIKRIMIDVQLSIDSCGRVHGDSCQHFACKEELLKMEDLKGIYDMLKEV